MNKNPLECVKELLFRFEDFTKETTDLKENWLDDFIMWLLANIDRKVYEDHPQHSEEKTDLLIGLQLVNISNLLKSRLNIFVGESKFATFMDFQFLYILEQHGEMTKSALISLNYMGMSSGIEVINRLVKEDWVVEKQNPKDKRSKLVTVTDSGKEQLLAYRDQGIAFYESFSQDLQAAQKKQVLYCLNTLNDSNN